jgi:hypothetical protein
VATPWLLTELTPIDTESSRKLTNPVGLFAPPFDTVAVITTGARVSSGLWLELSDVVVGDCKTVIARELDLLVVSFESPL